jgi:predicted DNA binding CopG/RHH family protein
MEFDFNAEKNELLIKERGISFYDEEKEIIESYSNININDIKRPTELQQKQFKKMANEFIKKEIRMSIRIDPLELNMIKEKANNHGLEYQTFVKSIIHKYLIGELVEKVK